MAFTLDYLESIEKQLGLVFLEVDEEPGNLCMANAEETRPDFRTTFTSIHLANYIFALEHSPRHHKEYHQFLRTRRIALLCPSDATEFWKTVEEGRKMKESPGSKEDFFCIIFLN